MEKFLGYLVGNASQGQLEFILYACLALVAYLLIFIWYAKQMKKRNIIYAQKLNKGTKRRGASAPLLLVDHPDNFSNTLDVSNLSLFVTTAVTSSN